MTSQMNKRELWDNYVQLANANKVPVGWRKGQYLFNQLYMLRPDIADRVRGSSIDPFHRDDKIPTFLQHVDSVWGID